MYFDMPVKLNGDRILSFFKSSCATLQNNYIFAFHAHLINLPSIDVIFRLPGGSRGAKDVGSYDVATKKNKQVIISPRAS